MNPINRTLLRLVAFLAVVAALGGFLVVAGPLAPAFATNPFLNGLILVVAGLGIGHGFRQVLRLRPEYRWLENYRRGRTASDMEGGPRLLAPMASMLGERERLSLSALSLRSLLDGLATRLDESRELARYMIGLLIFLGLIGTFWGLIGTITGVAGIISGMEITGDNAPQMFMRLKDGLEAPLGSMGTAFSSSLFGLAGALVLGFIDLQASQAQNRFMMDVEDWLAGAARVTSPLGGGEAEASVPAYLAALIEQTAENIAALRAALSQTEEGRRASHNTQLLLTERLGALADELRASNQHSGRLAEALNQGRLGLDDASRQHLRNLDAYMAHLVEDAATGRQQAVQELRSEIRVLSRTIAHAAGIEQQGQG